MSQFSAAQEWRDTEGDMSAHKKTDGRTEEWKAEKMDGGAVMEHDSYG